MFPQRTRKRRKVTKRVRPSRASRSESAQAVPPRPQTPELEGPFDALLRAVDPQAKSDLETKGGFERFVEPLLPELVDASAAAQIATINLDDNVIVAMPP